MAVALPPHSTRVSETPDRCDCMLEPSAPPDRLTVVHLRVEPEVMSFAHRPSSSTRLVELLLEVVGHLGEGFGSFHCPHRGRGVAVVNRNPYSVAHPDIDYYLGA